ncbi:IS110 family transposase [Cohnella nanjingensis]|uniref:IS110 family transposase n=1 Tax=Cohnella nanjingensis TaxID=1387779 RepID=UPI0035E3F724
MARAVDFRGIELGKDCVFHNDVEGLTRLSSWMKELGQAHGKTEIVFGIEPTGHYWFPIAAFLQEQGIAVVVVNPHHVNKTKELEDNSPTAEVGDLTCYDHGQQIIRLAGLNMKENSSGKRKGKTGITKRGRSRLR